MTTPATKKVVVLISDPLAVKWFLSDRLKMMNDQAFLDGTLLSENGYAAD